MLDVFPQRLLLHEAGLALQIFICWLSHITSSLMKSVTKISWYDCTTSSCQWHYSAAHFFNILSFLLLIDWTSVERLWERMKNRHPWASALSWYLPSLWTCQFLHLKLEKLGQSLYIYRVLNQLLDLYKHRKPAWRHWEVGCQAGLLVANAAGLFMLSWRKTWDHSLQLLVTVLGTFWSVRWFEYYSKFEEFSSYV